MKKMCDEGEEIRGNQAIYWLLAVAFCADRRRLTGNTVNRTEKRIEKFKDADECFQYLEKIGAFDEWKSSVNID